MIEPNTLLKYASGRIVVWVPPDSKVDLVGQKWNALLDPTVQKIAIANPEHAPYGRAAVEALKHAGLYEEVQSKLVYGENISQAAQFVQSGNAQAGIIALSLAVSPAMNSGQRWGIPVESICSARTSRRHSEIVAKQRLSARISRIRFRRRRPAHSRNFWLFDSKSRRAGATELHSTLWKHFCFRFVSRLQYPQFYS